jgi:hypothetical protein
LGFRWKWLFPPKYLFWIQIWKLKIDKSFLLNIEVNSWKIWTISSQRNESREGRCRKENWRVANNIKAMVNMNKWALSTCWEEYKNIWDHFKPEAKMRRTDWKLKSSASEETWNSIWSPSSNIWISDSENSAEFPEI